MPITVEGCTGCYVCGDICPVNAIQFREDDFGFWYPYINNDICIRCEKCVQVCTSKSCLLGNDFESYCLGGWNLDESVRLKSTSGGVFYSLAKEWILSGGVCYGAAYCDELEVRHIRVDSIDDLSKLQSSKYVQSKLEGVFDSIKKDLQNGYKVLFSGTPCQVNAVLNSIKEQKNLYTIDIVCHGVPSPKVYKQYMRELEEKYSSKVSKIIFKNKKRGWHNLGTLIKFDNGKAYFRVAQIDPYMKSYIVSDVNIRESCYDCKHRNVRHNSDITLGDFWGVDIYYPQYDDNKGVSLIIVNSQRGKRMIEKNKKQLFCFSISIDEAKNYNPALYQSRTVPESRPEFFTNCYEESIIDAALKSCNQTKFEFWKDRKKDQLRYICEQTGIIKIIKKLREKNE